MTKQEESKVEIGKYSFFYNEEGDYTVIHKEGDTETYIAITDNAEKADFITKACNQLHASVCSPSSPDKVGEFILEDMRKALNLAQMEIRGMYLRLGIKGSNVLDIIDTELQKLQP